MPNQDIPKSPSARDVILARAAAEQAAREKVAATSTEERRVRNALLLHQSHDLRTRATAAMSDKALTEPLNVRDAYRDAVDDIVGAVAGEKKKLRRDTSHTKASEILREHFHPDEQHGPLNQEDDARWSLAERALREEKMNAGAPARAIGKQRKDLRKELTTLTDEAEKYGNDGMVVSNLGVARGELSKKSERYSKIKKTRDTRIAESDEREINEPKLVVELKKGFEREREKFEKWFKYQKARIAELIPGLESKFFGPLLPYLPNGHESEQAVSARVRRLRVNLERCDNPKKKGLIFKDALFLHTLPREGLSDEYAVPMSEVARKRGSFARELNEWLLNAQQRRATRARGARSIFKEVLDAVSGELYKASASNRIQEWPRGMREKRWHNEKALSDYAEAISEFHQNQEQWYTQAQQDIEQLVNSEISRVADAWYKRNFGSDS